MTVATKPTCHLVRPTNLSWQAGAGLFRRVRGVGRVEGICMHLLSCRPAPGEAALTRPTRPRSTCSWARRIPPRAKLEHLNQSPAGDFIYIPAGVSHQPFNPTDAPARALIARTDPNEQESVVVLPHLDTRVPA